MKKTGLLLCLLVFLMSNVAWAQNRQISGTVKDNAGKPIADATVLVKGTTISTKSDNEGHYSVNVPSSLVKVELLISHVNFDARTIGASGDVANVSLEQKDKQLEDVVIIGYGTQKKRNVTGAVATYNAEKLDERPVQRVDQALIGQMAGVQVKQTTGALGKPFSINIRGTGSISASNEPLYVIDDFPVTSEGQNSAGNFDNGSPLDNLNPNDIESIQVLKDAAAAAIYGSRASNGVVIITTKKGKRGKNQINFNTYAGFNKVAKRIDLLDAEQWIARAKEYIDAAWVASGTGRTADQTNEQKRAILGLAPGAYNTSLMYDDRWDIPGHPGLDFIDWQDEVFRMGNFQNYQLSASGGNDKARYYVSGSHQNNTGYVQNMTYKTYSARANVDVNLTKNMKFGITISPSYSIKTDPGIEGKDNTLHKIVSMAPVQETANMGADGRYTARYLWAGSAADETGRFDRIGDVTLFRTLASAYFEVELLKGLKAKASFNFDNADNVNKGYVPSTTSLTGISGTYSSYRKQTFVNENTLNYVHSFRKVHNINAIAGYSYNNYKIDKVSLSSGANYTNFSTQTLPTGSTGTTSGERAVLISYFGRLQYDYNGKYLLSASIRSDGSSRFGSDNRWGTFPSVSAGWRISDENFFKVKSIDDLKLRYSYGGNGNNNIGNYAWLSTLTNYNYTFGGAVSLGTGVNGITNPYLHWETSYTHNIGFDASFLKSRITTSFDYYIKTNKDLLLKIPSLSVSGNTTLLTNIGQVRNKGWELELGTKNVITKKFQWNTNLNFSQNENKLLQLDGVQQRIEITPNFGEVPYALMQVGLPLNAIYVVRQNGVLTQDDIDKGYPMFGTQKVGDPRYVDFDGDGKITATDRQFVGRPGAKYIWGITNTFKYKNFDLTVLLQGQNGGYVYSLFGRAMNLTGMSSTQNALDVDVKTRGNYKTSFGSIVNTDWLYKSDYVSLRTINLGYNLKPLFKSGFVNAARVYFSAENLFYKDKYAGGYNPEATNANLSGDTVYPSAGDYGGLPLSKSFVLGVNFTF
ncbi:MAG: TonB-dependent receptor [Ferruginibacter sp.]